MHRCYAIYPNVMKLDYDNKRTREGRVVEAAANADKPPIVLMEEPTISELISP